MISKQQLFSVSGLWKSINTISKIYDIITHNEQQSTTETNITNQIKALLRYITRLSMIQNDQQYELESPILTIREIILTEH